MKADDRRTRLRVFDPHRPAPVAADVLIDGRGWFRFEFEGRGAVSP